MWALAWRNPVLPGVPPPDAGGVRVIAYVKYAHGAVEQAVLRLRHPALVAIHARPRAGRARTWTITGAGRLTVRRVVSE